VKKTSEMYLFWRKRLPKIGLATGGLVVCAFGGSMQLSTSIGILPWNALNQGLSKTFGMTFGSASILVSVAVVLLDLLLREPIGIGTILDSLVTGLSMDFFIWLDLFPYQTEFLPSLAILLASMVVLNLGTAAYISAGLSCGPRDALMVAVGKRIPRLSIGTITIIVNCAVAATGFALGGSLGLGTVICMFGNGVVMDGVNKLLRFDPRKVEQEGLIQTFQAFRTALGTVI